MDEHLPERKLLINQCQLTGLREHHRTKNVALGVGEEARLLPERLTDASTNAATVAALD